MGLAVAQNVAEYERASVKLLLPSEAVAPNQGWLFRTRYLILSQKPESSAAAPRLAAVTTQALRTLRFPAGSTR
jgi:hypothetical protein